MVEKIFCFCVSVIGKCKEQISKETIVRHRVLLHSRYKDNACLHDNSDILYKHHHVLVASTIVSLPHCQHTIFETPRKSIVTFFSFYLCSKKTAQRRDVALSFFYNSTPIQNKKNQFLIVLFAIAFLCFARTTVTYKKFLFFFSEPHKKFFLILFLFGKMICALSCCMKPK